MTDPMHQGSTPPPHALCGARTRDGDTCKNPPMHGQARCRMHGGATPSARAAAERRLEVAEAARHVEAWGGRTDVTPPGALLELVQTKAAEVAYWNRQLAALDDPDQIAASPAVGLLHKAQNQLGNYSAAALKAGVDEALAQMTTMQAAWLVPLLGRVVDASRTRPDLGASEVVLYVLDEADSLPPAAESGA